MSIYKYRGGSHNKPGTCDREQRGNQGNARLIRFLTDRGDQSFTPTEAVMVCFEFDWCWISVDEHGFASIRDCYEGLEMAELDSVEEAIEFLNSLPQE